MNGWRYEVVMVHVSRWRRCGVNRYKCVWMGGGIGGSDSDDGVSLCDWLGGMRVSDGGDSVNGRRR